MADSDVPVSLDALIERVLAGDEAAWSELVAAVHGNVLAICQRRRLGDRRWNWEDVYRDVALSAIGKLHERDFAALRRYVATRAKYPTTSFTTWLATVVHHAYVDYLRAQPEIQRQRHEDSRKLVELRRVELDDAHSAGPSDIETRVEVRRILACLLASDFPVTQRRAVLLWLEGASAGEIANELGLANAKDSHRLLRAARQRLRRAFETR